MAFKKVNVVGKVSWARVYQPDSKFNPDNPVWSLDIDVAKDVKDALESLCKNIDPSIKRITFLSKSDEGYKIKAKRKLKNAKGEENQPPRVIDAEGKPFNKNIGNGSLCRVTIAVYDWDNKFGKGFSADLDTVQVLEHVPYGDDEIVELGAVPIATTKSHSSNDDIPFDDEIPEL
jgi:hypothetical protein